MSRVRSPSTFAGQHPAQAPIASRRLKDRNQTRPRSIGNIQFLDGESPNVGGQTQLRENAETAIVYATFWIEKVTHKVNGHFFMQLQYAQMVVLDFPIFHLLQQAPPVYVNLGWPHISVATLRKSFG